MINNLVDGTHALMISYLYPREKKMGKWWKSKNQIEGIYGYGGSLLNKNWVMKEEWNMKINHWFQGGMNLGRVVFEEWKWQEIPSVLTIEHFGIGKTVTVVKSLNLLFLGFIIWGSGLLISTLAFIIEKRKGKKQN